MYEGRNATDKDKVRTSQTLIVYAQVCTCAYICLYAIMHLCIYVCMLLSSRAHDPDIAIPDAETGFWSIILRGIYHLHPRQHDQHRMMWMNNANHFFTIFCLWHRMQWPDHPVEVRKPRQGSFRNHFCCNCICICICTTCIWILILIFNCICCCMTGSPDFQVG